MKKNVAGQTVGAQMVSATDGSAITGGTTITVEVTIDGGTQATGTVSSGDGDHRGNGYFTYSPSQAETNGNLLAFTFHGTGAIPVTRQVYTTFPQTGDVYPLVDTEVASILAAVDTEVAAIKAKTDNLPAAPAAVADIPTANANADALLDRAAGIETNRTLRQGLRLILAAVAGKLSGAATTSITCRDTNDSKNRIVATVDTNGNRSAIILDAS